MEIRDARAEDAAALAALILELEHPVTVEEVTARLPRLAAIGRPVLVAEAQGRVIGCVSWSVMDVLHRPGPVGRVSMLVVTEACRGEGAGRALVAEVERRCAALGCVLVEVTSNARRTGAHAFYEGLGYERTSVRFAKRVR